jgi:uncharacterized protein (DUF2147 family)
MRLTTLTVIGAAAFLGAAPALALGPEDVLGIWSNPDSGALVHIYACDGSICAKIVSVPGSASKDVNNPNPALRGRSLAGVETWRHARETAPLQWSGSAYNPQDGATVYGTLHLTSETALLVASCDLNAMPCLERTWTKVSAEPAGFTTLVSEAVPEQGEPKDGSGPAPRKAAPQKTGPRYLHKARKPKEQTANQPAGTPASSSNDFFSRIQLW